MLILAGLLYGEVLADLAHNCWTDPAVSYRLLVLPLALFLAWQNRESR